MAEAERWTEGDSDTYRALAEVAVPERERQIALVTELVMAANADGPALDLCCGEGLLSAALLAADADLRVLAYDGSESMLAETRRRCGDTRLTTQRIDIDDSGWRRFERPLRAAVSSLAVHHLDGPAKRAMFADLYAALAPGGVFVLADVILPATPTGFEIAARHYDEEAERRSLAIIGDRSGFEAFRRAEWNSFANHRFEGIDRPSTVADHIDWLREVGFRDVDLHWMMAGHALFSAWKR